MNWDAIGAVGEILSAVGVIVSLLYLASQIRIQNSESRSRAFSEVSIQWNYLLGDIATNSELAELWGIGLTDYTKLDNVQKIQFYSQAARMFKMIEGFYLQRMNHKLSEETWSGLQNAITDTCRSEGIKFWWSYRRNWYGAQFQEFIDSCMLVEGDYTFVGDLRPNEQNDT